MRIPDGLQKWKQNAVSLLQPHMQHCHLYTAQQIKLHLPNRVMLPHWDVSVADPRAVETGPTETRSKRSVLLQLEELENDLFICLLTGKQRFEVGMIEYD